MARYIVTVVVAAEDSNVAGVSDYVAQRLLKDYVAENPINEDAIDVLSVEAEQKDLTEEK